MATKQKAASEVYDRYRRLDRALTERYRARINAADPRVGMDQAFHLAHNWGNEGARVLLLLHRKRGRQLSDRSRREYLRAWDK
jgi:hypothetical protein